MTTQRSHGEAAVSREAIATIIQPALPENYADNPKLFELLKEAREDALQKADAILALFHAHSERAPDKED